MVRKDLAQFRFTALLSLGATLFLCLALATSAFAASDLSQSDDSAATTTTKKANAVPGADSVDDLLTNPNLRAYSGSKSRWSVSNAITYDGGTVSQPFGQGRPDIANASATSVVTDINDTLNVKLALTPVQSLMLGVGIRKMAPFTGKGPPSSFYASGGRDVDVFDPSLTYQYIYKAFGVIQAVAQFGVTQYTRTDIHSSSGGNLDKNWGFDQENIYEIGNLSIGGSIGFSGNLPTDYSTDYSKFQYWFDPYVEYRINDTFNFRTVFNAWSFEYYQQAGTVHDTYTQSVGIGMSITRDFFVYPNVQFLPGQVNKNLTNVGISATLNLF